MRLLADSLARDGIIVFCDQFQGFVGNLDTWMEENVNFSDFILMIMTNRYIEIQKGMESKGGWGVAYESLIIRNQIYKDRSQNKKFIPVYFSQNPVSPGSFPSWMGLPSSFCLDEFKINQGKENEYTLLYRVLTNQPILPGNYAPVVILGNVYDTNTVAANDVKGKLDSVIDMISEPKTLKSGIHALREIIKNFCKNEKMKLLQEAAKVNVIYENFEKHQAETKGMDYLEK